MFHIFHPHLRNASICLNRGDIAGAKRILSNIIDEDSNVLAKVGQLTFHVERLDYFLERARDSNDVEEMNELVGEAAITLSALINLMQKILKEEVKTQ